MVPLVAIELQFGNKRIKSQKKKKTKFDDQNEKKKKKTIPCEIP
jgi:hypothetical protein